MEKLNQLYEGKAKKIYLTNDDGYVIVSYKDDATAFNGEKKGTILGKGVVNNKLTNHFMNILERHDIPTHFVKEISDRETIVKKVKIIPLEVIVRNVAAGSFSKRFGIKEGTILNRPSLEFSLKNDDLKDPLINTYHVLSIGIATQKEIDIIEKYSLKINSILKEYLLKFDVDLIDFKLEFGKTSDDLIVLADEISPDTCRFWDVNTHEKLDKDRFRRNLGNEEHAYREMLERIINN